MKIRHRTSNSPRSVTSPIRLNQGGHGQPDPYLAAVALGGISWLSAGSAYGPIPLDRSGNLSAKFLAATGKFKNSVYGPRVLQPGATGVYVITNYDSSRTYNIVARGGVITAQRDKTFYYQAPETPGLSGFTINDIPFDVIVFDSAANNIPVAPSITSPLNVSANYTLGTPFVTSAYGMLAGAGIHAATDFQIATNAGFTQIAASTTVSAGNLLTWTPTGLAEGTTYYIRARFKDIAKGYGPWGGAGTFTVVNDGLPNRPVYTTNPGTTYPGGLYGCSLAFAGDASRYAVGAPRERSSEGAVYVYYRGTIAHEIRLTSQVAIGNSTAVQNSEFGRSVAMSSNGLTLVVGAPGQGTGGTVYVYRKINIGFPSETWSLSQMLVSPRNIAGEQFGCSVSISADGSKLAVGSKGSNYAATLGGAAYVFVYGSSFTLQASMESDTPQSYAEAGFSVALSAMGNVLLVGKPGFNKNDGAVAVWWFTSGSWSLKTTMVAAANSGSRLGYAVASNDNGQLIAMSAPSESVEASLSGAVYTYRWDGTNYVKVTRLASPTAGFYSHFGKALAMSQDGTSLMASYDCGTMSAGGVSYATLTLATGVAVVQGQIKLSPSLVGDSFGQAIAAPSNRSFMLVGSPWQETEDGQTIGLATCFANP